MTITVSFMNFGPIVTGLATCACDALDDAGIPVCSCLGATIGPPAWDRCDCACSTDPTAVGQLGIYVPSIFPSTSFPTPTPPDRFDQGCGPGYLVASIVLEIARCVPVGEGGNLPTPVQTQSTALSWHNDATILRQALGCCLVGMKANRLISRFAIGATTMLPEQGGCAGLAIALHVGISHCLCP